MLFLDIHSLSIYSVNHERAYKLDFNFFVVRDGQPPSLCDLSMADGRLERSGWKPPVFHLAEGQVSTKHLLWPGRALQH